MPRQRPVVTAVKIAIALGAGIVVFVLLFPYAGTDADPPVCSSVFDYAVPCATWPAPVAAIGAAAVVGLVLLALGRRR